MNHRRTRRRLAGGCTTLAVLCLALPAGCSTDAQTAALAVAGITAVGASSPNNEIEQLYYLGVFDAEEQLPPTIYRVRVRGQASALSATRFASGWVRADLIDSLGTSVGFDEESGRAQVTKGDDRDQNKSMIPTGRRLFLFGPEGFREAPADHRLVIVMGSSPQAFFQAIDESLAVVAEAQQENIDSAFAQKLFTELQRVQAERIRLASLRADLPDALSR